MVKAFGYFAYHEWASQEARPWPHVPGLESLDRCCRRLRSVRCCRQGKPGYSREASGLERPLQYPGLLPQRLRLQSEVLRAETLRISPAGSAARKAAQFGEALQYLGLLPQRLAVVERAAVGCPRVSEDREGWSNPSPGKQFSLVQIPNGGGDQGYFTCP